MLLVPPNDFVSIFFILFLQKANKPKSSVCQQHKCHWLCLCGTWEIWMTGLVQPSSACRCSHCKTFLPLDAPSTISDFLSSVKSSTGIIYSFIHTSFFFFCAEESSDVSSCSPAQLCFPGVVISTPLSHRKYFAEQTLHLTALSQTFEYSYSSLHIHCHFGATVAQELECVVKCSEG